MKGSSIRALYIHNVLLTLSYTVFLKNIGSRVRRLTFALLACRVVMVVGAGRGPLVSASITAAARADRRVKVYAVEKNANAVVT